MLRFSSFHTLAALAVLASAAPALSGCHDDTTPASACPPDNVVRGVCAGVPQAEVCGSDSCTDGVSCARVVAVSDASSLAAALGTAQPGTCLTLAPGSYGHIELPAGTSLLGRSADKVSVAGVSIASGQGTVLRGIAIGAGGLAIGSAAVRVDSVRLAGSASDGVAIGSGSSVTFVQSEIAGAGRYGLTASDGANVTLERTIVGGSEGPAVWVACSGGCSCATPPQLTALRSIVRDARLGGVVLLGAVGAIDTVDIKRTKVGDNALGHYGEGGGGLSVASCSSLDAKRLSVTDSMSFGVLVDDANALLGGTGPDEGIEVSRNLMGIWMQHISTTAPETVKVQQGEITANRGVGIGISGEAHGILVICKTGISGTTSVVVPVYAPGTTMIGGSKEVGDGLNWLEGSEVSLDQVTISSSARASFLIDGAVTGKLSDIVLSGGDEQKGILQQDYTGGSQPTAGANVPPIKTQSGQTFALPVEPQVFKKAL